MALRMNIATVTGPTPPGTGVTQLATSFTASVSTSPTIVPWPSGPATWLMPISMTAAPGFTMSAFRNFGLPTATMTASARLECAATERVRWWHTVTVAPSAISMNAVGLPTISEWPTTTASSPCRARPVGLISSPAGAAADGARRRVPAFEVFRGVKRRGKRRAVVVRGDGPLQDHAENVRVVVHGDEPELAFFLRHRARPGLMFEAKTDA